jgi:hypothetical protein
MESNVRGLRCDKCWNLVEALYVGRFGGWVCRMCWAWQNGDLPEARHVEPALKMKSG